MWYVLIFSLLSMRTYWLVGIGDVCGREWRLCEPLPPRLHFLSESLTYITLIVWRFSVLYPKIRYFLKTNKRVCEE